MATVAAVAAVAAADDTPEREAPPCWTAATSPAFTGAHDRRLHERRPEVVSPRGADGLQPLEFEWSPLGQ